VVRAGTRPTLPVSRPAGRRDRSERAPSDTRRPDSHPARARASGVGYTGCWVRPAVRFYVRLSGCPAVRCSALSGSMFGCPAVRFYVRLSGSMSGCPVLCPAVRFYARLSGSMSGCPVLCPAVWFYVRLSGSMSGCPVLCPAVRFYVRLSGSMSGCPVICSVVRLYVRLSGYMSGCPAVRLYVRLSGCSACVRIGHGSRIRCAADPTLPVSRPAGRRDRSERASSATTRPDSHPAPARASGVGCTGGSVPSSGMRAHLLRCSSWKKYQRASSACASLWMFRFHMST
jgi:hypothetical protein